MRAMRKTKPCGRRLANVRFGKKLSGYMAKDLGQASRTEKVRGVPRRSAVVRRLGNKSDFASRINPHRIDYRQSSSVIKWSISCLRGANLVVRPNVAPCSYCGCSIGAQLIVSFAQHKLASCWVIKSCRRLHAEGIDLPF